MSNTLEKKSGVVMPPPDEEPRAVSVQIPFDRIAKIIASTPPPRRPTKCSPDPLDDDLLDEEIEAWNEASDADFEKFEDDLGE